MTLCDIGNTSYHFLKEDTEFKYSVDESINALQLCEPIYFISVNDKASIEFVSHFPQAKDLKEILSIKTQYASTLGIDRAMACSNIENGIVVDFGSAITIDVMRDSLHLGGYILPGLESLKNIYPKISNQLLFDFVTNIQIDHLPTTTNEAISNAIHLMIIEPIKKLQRQYEVELIFTGEHGKYFIDYFYDAKYEPHLIFKNMKQLIQSTQRNEK